MKQTSRILLDLLYSAAIYIRILTNKTRQAFFERPPSFFLPFSCSHFPSYFFFFHSFSLVYFWFRNVAFICFYSFQFDLLFYLFVVCIIRLSLSSLFALNVSLFYFDPFILVLNVYSISYLLPIFFSLNLT